jgi:hypothetical protein
MESIVELKPLFLRIFGEIEGLHEKVKERDQTIQRLEGDIERLKKENEIYHKVVRMYDGLGESNELPAGCHNSVVEQESDDETDLPIPMKAPESEQNTHRTPQNTVHVQEAEVVHQDAKEVTVNAVKRGRRKQNSENTETAEEKAERMREYHRQYRIKRREAKK